MKRLRQGQGDDDDVAECDQGVPVDLGDRVARQQVGRTRSKPRKFAPKPCSRAAMASPTRPSRQCRHWRRQAPGRRVRRASRRSRQIAPADRRSRLRPRPIASPTASSAVGTVSRSGTTVSQMPASAQAAVSKLSKPLSAQATTRSFGRGDHVAVDLIGHEGEQGVGRASAAIRSAAPRFAVPVDVYVAMGGGTSRSTSWMRLVTTIHGLAMVISTFCATSHPGRRPP